MRCPSGYTDDHDNLAFVAQTLCARAILLPLRRTRVYHAIFLFHHFQVLLLNTMRRYIPRIHLIESTDGSNFDFNMKKEFCFPETEFMAVSAYRNKQVNHTFH